LKLKEGSKKIEMISKELAKEKERNERLLKDNERLEQELDLIKCQTTGDNSPRTLKKHNKQHIEDIKALTNQSAILKQTLQSSSEEKESVVRLLGILRKSTLEAGQDEYEQIVKKIKDSRLLKEVQEVFKVIEEFSSQLNALTVSNEQMRSEINVRQQINNSLSLEIEHLKKQLIIQDNKGREREEELLLIRSELGKTRTELKEQEEAFKVIYEKLQEVKCSLGANNSGHIFGDNPIMVIKELLLELLERANCLNFEMRAKRMEAVVLEDKLKEIQKESNDNISSLKKDLVTIKAQCNEANKQNTQLHKQLLDNTLKSDKRILSLIYQKTFLTSQYKYNEELINLIMNRLSELVKPNTIKRNRKHIIKFKSVVTAVIAFNRLLHLSNKTELKGNVFKLTQLEFNTNVVLKMSKRTELENIITEIVEMIANKGEEVKSLSCMNV